MTLSSSSCCLPSGCEVLGDELAEGLGAVAAHLVARAVQALAQAGSEVEKIYLPTIEKYLADGHSPEGGLVQQLEGGGGGTPGGQLQLEAGQSALNLPRLQ